MFYYNVSAGEQKCGDQGKGFKRFPPQQILTSLIGKLRRLFATRILKKFLVATTKEIVVVHSLDPGGMDSEFPLD